MENPVAVALVVCPDRARLFIDEAPPRIGAQSRVVGQAGLFPLFNLFSDIGKRQAYRLRFPFSILYTSLRRPVPSC
jgi:hypothetical protein